MGWLGEIFKFFNNIFGWITRKKSTLEDAESARVKRRKRQQKLAKEAYEKDERAMEKRLDDLLSKYGTIRRVRKTRKSTNTKKNS